MIYSSPLGAKAPLYVSLFFLVIGGIFLLERADAQARDTIRKHHLQDIEQSLYFARNIHGTFPPYNQSSWCGILSAPENTIVLTQIEETLRAQNQKYANPDKPFPKDPQADLSSPEALAKGGSTPPDYFYWKRSPASFELYAILETDQNRERPTSLCPESNNYLYDYGISSVWREN